MKRTSPIRSRRLSPSLRLSPRQGGGSPGLFVFGEEPDAGGDLGVGKELAGERDHAFDEIGFD